MPRRPHAGRGDALQGRVPRGQGPAARRPRRPPLQLPGGGPQRGDARPRPGRAGRRPRRPRRDGAALPGPPARAGRLLLRIRHGAARGPPRRPRARRSSRSAFPLRHVPDTSFLDGSRTPRLFVQGARDEFGPEATIRALVEPLPPPRELVIITESDHFFGGHLDALQEAVRAWAARRPWEAA